MQPDATGRADKQDMPLGCVPLSKIEQAIRRLVENELPRIPNTRDKEFAGTAPVSTWVKHLGADQPPRDWGLIDRHMIASGVVALMMERLIWPSSRSGAGDTNSTLATVFILLDGRLHPFHADNVLYLCDPATAPQHCNTKSDALCFREFALNRQNNHPFVDRAEWIVREEPLLGLSASDVEAEELRAIWARLSAFAGASIVYRKPSGRKDRAWKAPSEVARKIEADLRRISNNTLPREGTPQFDEMLKALRTILVLMPEEQRRGFGSRELAAELGLHPDQRQNSAVRKIMCELRKPIKREG